jgi:hypothetical protein
MTMQCIRGLMMLSSRLDGSWLDALHGCATLWHPAMCCALPEVVSPAICYKGMLASSS